MRFSFNVIIYIYFLSLVSCTYKPKADVKSENLIGNKLSSISTLQSIQGEQSKSLIMFDPTIRKVHKFDLLTMTHESVWTVANPEIQHSIIYIEPMSYYIDLTAKGITVQNIKNLSQKSRFDFEGQPVSAAFSAEKNLLVVYDENQKITIIKLDADGLIEFTSSYGGLLSESHTVQAGDLTEKGDLILTTVNRTLDRSSSFLTVIPLDSMNQVQSAEKIAPALNFKNLDLFDVSWVAPIGGDAEQVLLRANNKISLYDLKTQQIVSSIDTQDWYIARYSKSKNPHIILFKNERTFFTNSSSDREMQVVYVENNVIKTKSIFTKIVSVTSSYLDLEKQSFSLTSNKNKEYNTSEFYGLNEVRTQRVFHKLQFNDFLVKNEIKITDGTEVVVGEDFIFNLFPSKLGYAERIDLKDQSKKVLELFNLSEIK